MREFAKLRDWIRAEEGFRSKPYFDCCGKFFRDCRCTHQGKLTIGYGHNIEDIGITAFQANLMNSDHLAQVTKIVTEQFTWLKGLSAERQDVVFAMVYQMGMKRFLGFQKLIQALQRQDYEQAAREILDSNFAHQARARAARTADAMRTGVLPEMK